MFLNIGGYSAVFSMGDDCGLLLVWIRSLASSNVVHLLLDDASGGRLVVESLEVGVGVSEALQSSGHRRRLGDLFLTCKATVIVGTIPKLFHSISFNFCDESIGVYRIGSVVLTHSDFAGVPSDRGFALESVGLAVEIPVDIHVLTGQVGWLVLRVHGRLQALWKSIHAGDHPLVVVLIDANFLGVGEHRHILLVLRHCVTHEYVSNGVG